MGSIAINVEHLSKEYRLGVMNHGTLAEDLRHRFKRWRGKPDGQQLLTAAEPDVAHVPRLREGRFYALEDVSLDIEQGASVGVIGANGAGKSTLLKILSRITVPTSGRVRVKGRLATLLEVGTGFHPELTGRENIYLNGAILGMTHQEVRRNFDEIVDFADIDQFIDTPVKRYSSGMYVRLAFAVAAHLEPEILIVDEVLAVGDLNFQKKCFGRMDKVGREGRTVIFVSHNLPAVGRLCPKSILLEDGRLVAHTNTVDVIAAYVKRGLTEAPADLTFDQPLVAGKCGKIRRISLENSKGQVAGSVELTEPFYVSVEYDIVEPVEKLTVSIEVHLDELQMTIISLSDTELEPQRLETRKPGRYKARVRIPDRILNTGVYHIRSGMVREKEIVDVIESPSFQIEDHLQITDIVGFSRKSSINALQLPWTVERLGTP
ncbi:sugar ABC transporter ATP-binding protein [Bradyrhizobium sp. CCBAU 51745]|uniref:ABC transporter ATP-binding protein n=1 Tax=Bradyrhizobium sp. CCBAU 51745 TaxID=1325099 RepID=UPI002304F329|nr:polysaccharide ABC transporter ATP-binding protein [Bradyrhizobium sp. CCBAU 51745]MDA9437530.1 sugar ABC transporter ATP-binding protein [Bradyrhizobium sp. CCBAU 51745]